MDPNDILKIIKIYIHPSTHGQILQIDFKYFSFRNYGNHMHYLRHMELDKVVE